MVPFYECTTSAWLELKKSHTAMHLSLLVILPVHPEQESVSSPRFLWSSSGDPLSWPAYTGLLLLNSAAAAAASGLRSWVLHGDRTRQTQASPLILYRCQKGQPFGDSSGGQGKTSQAEGHHFNFAYADEDRLPGTAFMCTPMWLSIIHIFLPDLCSVMNMFLLQSVLKPETLSIHLEHHLYHM